MSALSRRPGGPLLNTRFAVASLFFSSGAVLGGWAARIPALKSQVGLADAAWGTVVLAGGFGALVAMLYVRSRISTVDSRTLALIAFPFVLVLPAALAHAHRPVILAVGLFFQGAALGAAQAPMSTLASAVERERGRPLMSSFHGCFSVGGLAGGLVGAWAARQDIGPAVQFGVGNVAFAVLIAVVATRLPRGTARRPEPTGPRPPRRPRQLAVLAGIAFGSLFIEGACTQWSAIYLRESLGSSPGLAAVAFTAFACSMAVGRLSGDRLMARFGHNAVIRWGAGASGITAATGLASGTQVGGVLAFGCLGLGLAAVVPAALSLASRLPGVHPGRAVASVSVAAWPATLFGPPFVGAVAGLTSLAVALTVLVPLCALTVAMLTRSVDEAPHRVSSGPSV